MSWRVGAALSAASAVYLVLVLSVALRVGANYEEVVPYVLSPLDIRGAPAVDDGSSAPRFVMSNWLPRLAFEPADGVRLPLLNQLYMTDHLSYGGVGLAATGIDPLLAARLWHAMFGIALLWLLWDVVRLLGMSPRAALIAAAIAATSLHVTTMYAPARFDESLASFCTVAVLWAALRYSRDHRERWIWTGAIAFAFGVSGKVTALWPLAGLALAGWLAGWRPPPWRALVIPALAVAPLFAPMIGFAIAGPAAGGEVDRRLQFLTNLFSSNAIPGTTANLIDYIGSWGSLVSVMIRGSHARPANMLGQALTAATLTWLIVRASLRGAVPRRARLETHMLAFLGVVFILVAMFFRERRDYQFSLVVPLYAVAMAGFLDWVGRRVFDRALPVWAAGVALCAVPVGLNLWEQRALHDDLARAANAMVDLGAQRASALWLAERGARNPIVVTFYAVGTYELLSGGAVRPVYAYPMLRLSKGGGEQPDPVAVWRTLLSEPAQGPRFAVLPLGENAIEAQHFNEPAIRAALMSVAQAERVAVFGNAVGEPLLEVWQVALKSASDTA